MAKTKKRKGGRPSKYETIWKHKLVVIEGWAREGLSDEQIAKNMDISTSTLYEWKKKHPEFSEALSKSKDVADYEVENALYKKAIGYTVTLPQQKVSRDGEIIEYEQTIYIQPDVTAQKFWLVNRKPESWRDRQQTEVTGKDGGPIEIQDAREKLIKKLTKDQE